jgi:DNA-binding IclR family transcriptional regulator
MVRAVDRALSILEAFDTARPSLALRDICEHTGIAKATAFHFIRTLEHAGYLVRLENQRLCLAVTGPSVRVDPRQDVFVKQMVEAGSRLSAKLGGKSALPAPSRVARGVDEKGPVQKDRQESANVR